LIKSALDFRKFGEFFKIKIDNASKGAVFAALSQQKVRR
jgi:hypothetical protein